MIIKRLYNILQPSEKRSAAKVAATLLVGTLLDFISLATLLPILYYLLGNSNNEKDTEAALFFCAIALGIIIIKSLLGILFTRIQNRYLYSIFKRISLELFRNNYNRGLLFIRENGTTKLSHEINILCFNFIQYLLAPFLKMVGELVLIILIAAALTICSPISALIITLTLIPFTLIHLIIVKKRSDEYGKTENQLRRNQAKIINETYRGYTEIRVNGAYEMMERNFSEGLESISNIRSRLNTLLRLPSMMSEAAIIFALALLIIFASSDGITLLIGTFAIAAFRIIPAIRSVMVGITQMNNGKSTLDTIEKGLDMQETIASDPTEGNRVQTNTYEFNNGDPIISINEISFSYPDGKSLFKNFSCTVSRGEFVGFKGESGVGKSTLFNLILGLLAPQKGEIFINSAPLNKESSNKWLQQCGYVPQDIFIFNGTIAENIALDSHYSVEKMRKVVGQVALKEWIASLPEGVNTRLNEDGTRLSGGQRQRIGIARALYRNISILLLDEATSALDSRTELEINKMLLEIKEQYNGLTILSIAHRESSLSLCDRVITL